MGNGCLYGQNNINNEKDVDLNENNENKENSSKTQKHSNNKQLNTEGNDLKNTNSKSKISQLVDYFNQGETAIIEEINRGKQKAKVINKKSNNEKYELMLKRLLEQQNIKKIGPKRRQTIRTDGDKIHNIVKELLQENKNNVLKGTLIAENLEGTLIIKQSLQKQGKYFSLTIDKNPLLINNKKKVGNNFFKKRNSLNEMINKGDLSEFQKSKSRNSAIGNI